MKFFINSNVRGYLRGLEHEFGESSNAIRVELNRLEKAGMLSSEVEGNKKFFQANIDHPLFNEVRSILLKHVGIDQVLEKVIKKIGNINKVYLVGSFSRGQDSPIIDLLLIGDDINKVYLYQLADKVEKMIKRKIRTIIYTLEEYEELDVTELSVEPILLWSIEQASH